MARHRSRHRGCRLGPGLFGLGILLCLCFTAAGPSAAAAPDRLSLAGMMRDAQGRALEGVQVQVEINGQPLVLEEPLVTNKRGAFVVEAPLPAGVFPSQAIIKATKHGFQPLAAAPLNIVGFHRDPSGARVLQGAATFTLERRFGAAAWLAGGVLAAVYILIALEWQHRTLAATLGAAALLFVSYILGTFFPDFRVLTFSEAMAAIDMNVILLLLGMMLMVGVLRKTGLFRWLALQAYALARGRVLVLVCLLMLFTAAASAFVDNITVILLVAPLTIELAVPLKVNPTAFLLPEIFAANLGGAATLIGDPPNLLVGSAAGFSFLDFLTNVSGIVLICLAVALVFYFFWYRRAYRRVFDLDFPRTLAFLQREYRIREPGLLRLSLIILAGVVGLFLVHHLLDMQPAVAALMGAMILLAISRTDIVPLLEKEVEWPTLLFLMALFILIAGAQASGLTVLVADWVDKVARGNLVLAILLVLWASALASCILENVAFTAAMVPIVAHLTEVVPGAQNGALWWALALGASLGGNGTMIGASANVVAVGLAERSGYPISFGQYFKSCFLPMVITVAIATVYLLVAY